MKGRLIVAACLALGVNAYGQDFRAEFEEFRHQTKQEFEDFRRQINREYADFLRGTWEIFQRNEPLPAPVLPKPVPPQPYVKPPAPSPRPSPEPVKPITILPIKPEPQPEPVSPIKERPVNNDRYITFNFFGANPRVRFSDNQRIRMRSADNNAIADAWIALSDGRHDNLVRDCLELRNKGGMSDWEYLQMLNALSLSIYGDSNEATLLMAWLFSQSGYQMRLGQNDDHLEMLFGSRHTIYNRHYYVVDGISFYPFSNNKNNYKIASAEFRGETPLSLFIQNEPLTGDMFSPERLIQSRDYPSVAVSSRVKKPLIGFYDTYPTSAIGGNVMSRWAMYANTPLSETTKKRIYPRFIEELNGMSKVESAERLLNWVQTGFEYEYDDVVWGHDRAFFAEETLYYPYSDCEDRSILFSRLVRDLLGLDVALIYYPGHLATAVKFNEDVRGTKVIIDNETFTVCDPTFIGAPVGAQMPGLDTSQIQAILLKK